MAETKLGKDAITLPVGTTAQRPANPEAGMIRFNTNEGQVERYDENSWGAIGLGELLAAVSEAADIDEAVSFVGRGAIVESDSNSNGHYVRWEDGFQVCFLFDGITLTRDGGNRSNGENWVFPQSFASPPCVFAERSTQSSISGVTDGLVVFGVTRDGETGRARANQIKGDWGLGDTVDVSIFAIGTWK